MQSENLWDKDERLTFFTTVGDGFQSTKDHFWATVFFCEALIIDPGNPWLWHNYSLAVPRMAGKERAG